MDKPLHPHYRADIDGLRSLAVLPVLAFHAFPNLIPGGFVGVDVFFVISGFLISNIIFINLRTDRFSWLEFYSKRIKRIFPALAVILGLSLVFGWLTLTTSEYQNLGMNVAGGAGFFSNLVLWSHSGYFDTSADYNPLLHLWSLGIEEQFYIVWPILLVLVWRRRKWVAPLVFLCFAASLIFNIVRIKKDPIGTFYLPFSRLWELLAGGLLAFYHSSAKPFFAEHRFKPVTENIFSITGLSLVIYGIAQLSKQSVFPGWNALIPVSGALLLIAAGPEAWINRKILSHRLMVFVGLISYPLYLWHWPLLSFARIIQTDEPSPGAKISLLGLSFLLAWITYRFVEKPLRWGTRKNTVGWLLGSVFGLGLIGFLISRDYHPKTRMADATHKLEFAFMPNRHDLNPEYIRLFREECNYITTEGKKIPVAPSCYLPTHSRSVFIWGDSHAQQFGVGLLPYLENFKVSTLQLASSACAPYIPDKITVICDRANQMAYEKILKVQPDVVILAQYGNHHIPGLKTVISALRRNGIKNIILMGPVPQWSSDLYKILARKFVILGKDIPERTSLGLSQETLAINKSLGEAFTHDPEVTYVPVMDKFCDNEGCLTKLGDDLPEDLVTFDRGHLSKRASSWFAQTVLGPVVLDLMHLKKPAQTNPERKPDRSAHPGE